MKGFESSEKIISLGKDKKNVHRFTTPAMYELEKHMIETILERQVEKNFKVPTTRVMRAIKGFEIKKSNRLGGEIKLTDEQKAMVYGLTTETGATKIALGIAGSGKSFALEVAKIAWEKQGFSVVGMAPTGKASVGLEESTGIKSSTIDRFLLKKNSFAPIKRPIFVIDEAGMIGSKKLAEVIKVAKKHEAKVVLVGDTRQLQPIEAGSATKLIESKIGSVDLKKVYRQRAEWQKRSTSLFASGHATQALLEYQRHGMLEVFSSAEMAHKGIVKEYIRSIRDNANDSKLIVAETNYQAQVLNNHLKNELFREGMVDSGQVILIKNKENQIEKRHFSAGERIVFTRNNTKLGIENGTFGDILSIRKQLIGHEIMVKTDSGKKIRIDSSKYKHLENGFAVTINKSQGATLDSIFFLLSEKTSRESTYVAMSRHKNNAKIYIDRSNFSDKIDWKRVDSFNEKDKKVKEIEEKTLAAVAQKASTPQQKDTSLDYNKSQKRYGLGRF